MPASTLTPQAYSGTLLAPTSLWVLFFLLLLAVLIIAYLSALVRRYKAKNSALQESIQQQELWTAYLGHELRNPLFVLNMQLEFLKLDCKEVPHLEQHADAATRASEDLLGLVNDISDSAQLRSGSFTLNPQPTNVVLIARSVYESYLPLAKDKGLEMSISLAGDAQQTVQLDSKRLYQVLANLVSNAIKYTPRGEIRVVVERAKRLSDQDCIGVSVIDTGIGIAKDAQQMIFEPYYKINASPAQAQAQHEAHDEHGISFGLRLRPSQGSGLGLAIVKSIAQASGWEIKVQSNAGEGSQNPSNFNKTSGSTFQLLIPVHPSHTSK